MDRLTLMLALCAMEEQNMGRLNHWAIAALVVAAVSLFMAFTGTRVHPAVTPELVMAFGVVLAVVAVVRR